MKSVRYVNVIAIRDIDNEITYNTIFAKRYKFYKVF